MSLPVCFLFLLPVSCNHVHHLHLHISYPLSKDFLHTPPLWVCRASHVTLCLSEDAKIHCSGRRICPQDNCWMHSISICFFMEGWQEEATLRTQQWRKMVLSDEIKIFAMCGEKLRLNTQSPLWKLVVAAFDRKMDEATNRAIRAENLLETANDSRLGTTLNVESEV